MPGYLSDGWLDGVELGRAPVGGGAGPVLVRRVVTGGPDGDVTLEAVVPGGGSGGSGSGGSEGQGGSGGDGAAAAGGERPAAQLTLTTTHAVATELDAGDVSPAVAYMQGRLKAEGDMPTLYALLAATA